MLKAATLFLSFLLGRMNSSHESFFSPEEIVDQATETFAVKVRSLMGQFALGAVGVILLTSGFLVAFFHVLDQWDVTDIVVIDAVFAGGIALSVLGLLLFGIAAKIPQKARATAERMKEDIRGTRHPHAGLEEAITALIMDHVKEREFSREQRQAEREQRSYSSSYREQASRKSDNSEAHVH